MQRPDTIDRQPAAEKVAALSGFPARLREAFDHATNAEIARRLQTSDATIKPYTDGARLPVPEMLLKIHRVTGINIHWLLTGEGPRRVDRSEIFSSEEESRISAAAKKAGRSFDDEIRTLTIAALDFSSKIT